MRALQFTEFDPVSNLRLIESPDPKADLATATVRRFERLWLNKTHNPYTGSTLVLLGA